MRRKVLYFIKGTSPTQQEAESAAKLGAIIRSSAAYREGDFVEKCDVVAGCFPEAYAHIPNAETVTTATTTTKKITTAEQATTTETTPKAESTTKK